LSVGQFDGAIKRPLFRGFLLGVGNAPQKAGEQVVAGREDNIQAVLEPTVEALGFELWGLELLSQGRHSLLRLYIDGEKGVNVDDCAEVSRQVGGVMDVEDPISGEYTLEVSSPGVDRLLFKPAQYVGYVGEWIELRLRAPYEGRRKFKGTLKAIEGEDIVIQVDDHEFLLPHSSIEKAQVKPRL
jgi:ribosome maturation factor RimP